MERQPKDAPRRPATGRNIAGILFDKDGTLFDFHATWSAWSREMIVELSAKDAGRAEAIAAALGFELASGRFLPGSPIIAETGAQIAARMLPYLPEWDRASLERRMDEAARAAPQAEAVPLVPLLQALAARGLALGVATNDAEAAARAQLERAGALGLLDFVAGYDSGHGGKPEPGQLLAFASAMALDPGSVAMIGDSLHDLKAARVAGMIAVGVLSGPARRDELAAAADVILPDIGALPAWLDGGAVPEPGQATGARGTGSG
ncbi:HAD family hydrolase [Profundibacterium mesophilum]|uniref:phosphoglycolate phosphatase n=1 Tax=Profundibacterium mesophilum KAUST100406-0324 TaxID=1037889 RepID=A0A921TGM4_9RHOB|nr:HAD family hydrolase [Profundibacterium mesophilum]KAF0677579.1 phosphoglycolate phosphatase [Profundibacterium mesophilum KAUST100406-0324]